VLDTKISDLLEIQHRFLRSIHLNRDFKDPSVLESYVLTEQIQSILMRIARGLTPNSGQRAWRITGDYGSGKSSFALVLAHLFSSKQSSLPAPLKNAIDFDKLGISTPRLLPILVTGTRAALSIALIQSLYNALLDVYERGREPNILKHIREFLATEPEPDVADATILTLLQETIECLVNTGKAAGVLIVLDELGKFLEFAALHPERQDIYLLQRLAEAAARSGKRPLLVIGLLHQSFHAYADQLSQATQKEWEKVSGRFEELLFSQSIDQIVTLTIGALHVKQERLPTELIHQAVQAMEVAHGLGWYGIATPLEYLRDKAAGMYPLHPTVLPVLIKVFTRFGQNERSLFSFLLSHEPFGLQDFARHNTGRGGFYHLHNLYDYTRATFGHSIGLRSYRNHWHLIESIVNNFHFSDELALSVLKTIALLNLVDDMHLLASKQAITLAIGSEAADGQRSVEDVLQELHTKQHIIHYRGAAGGYCLWPYTSVNLEKAYEDACRAVGSEPRVSLLIQDYLEKRPLVARRHYITTGTLRYFDVLYVPAAQLSTALTTNTTKAVGSIIVPLCETQEERQFALQFVQSPALADHPDTLIAIPQPLEDLAGLLQEAQRWQWISENVPELANDTYAAEEVTRQVISSKRMLEKRIYTSLGVQQSIDHMEALWFCKAKPIIIPDRRSLFARLSDICDEIYHQAPHILNELVNRDALSSAASSARLRLIELILASSSKLLMGLDPLSKPPEMSIYLSLCKKTGLHQETPGGWALAVPSPEQDISNVRPTLLRILEILKDQRDNRVSVVTIFSELRKAPYGVRDGLVPIFLAIFAIIHRQDLAFYENGSFLREISGHDFRRLIKAPTSFDVQLTQVSGPRTELLDALRMMLELPLQEDSQARILDIVRPLFVLAAQLPEYTRKTKNLSAAALSVRNVLLAAREPGPFLFHDLPQACGFEPFETDFGRRDDAVRFVKVLKDALDELKTAYSELRMRIKRTLMQAFDIPDHLHQPREVLANRAEAIAVKISEPRLKAFCLRLIDNLPENEWLESLGSFLCSKIPASWTDIDEQRFRLELNQLCKWFRRVEVTLFSEDQHSTDDSIIRVAVTQSNGKDVDQILYATSEEEEEVMHIQAEIMEILMYNKRAGLIAISRAFFQLLSQEEGDQV